MMKNLKKRIIGLKLRHWRKRFDKVLDTCRTSADFETAEYLEAKARWETATEEYYRIPWYI